ncbi:MAG: hypothetical protein R3293_07705 [Candidatus Promineifilaceae bacterium]|nr:hypothetical protein [Candidatus Promineifilaceae bacterium]
MFIGVYLFLTAVIFFIILLSRFGKFETDRARHWLLLFAGYSLLLALLDLAAFIFFSAWSGILTIGSSSSYSIPQDYLSFGLLGWFIFITGMVGILSPLLAAWLANKQYSKFGKN